MDNLFERFIKRNNKKRGFNITVATMVMFLLSCTLGFADTIINVNEKEYILHIGTNGENSYQWGNSGKYNTIDGNKLIINGKLDAGNNTQSLEISSNAKDVTVENNGFIDGVTIGRDYAKPDGTSATFTNNGVVSSEGNAIVVYSKNATVNNYGIIKGGEKGIEFANGVTEEKFNNKGILIDRNGKILNASITEQMIDLENGNYTVKNAVDSTGKEEQAIEMNGKEESNSFNKYILNGLSATVKVTSTGNTILNSIINSIGNGIEIENEAELGLTSTTINGNVVINGGTLILTDDKNVFNGTVKGSNNASLKLGYNVSDTTDYKNINNILKGSGIDNLKFSDNSNTIDTTKISFGGKFVGGNGEDNFKVSTDKVKGIKIDGGEGTDIITLMGQFYGKVSDFSGIEKVETLQLGNGYNTLDISNMNGKFSTIKGGEYGSAGSGSNTIKTSTDVNDTLTLVGGTNKSVKNILVLDNSNGKIDFSGKLDSNGGNWDIQVDNLKDNNLVTMNKENINGKVNSLEVTKGINGENETTNLVNLLNTSGIGYTTLSTDRKISDNLVFKDTTLNEKKTFGINYDDSVTMKGSITGDYAFKSLGGVFVPVINVDSTTKFGENTKVTSIDYQDKVSGVNFKVTDGALNLGKLTYQNGKLVYEGTNPFVDGYKYTINGNVQLGFEGLTDLKSGQKFNLDQRNDNIKVNGNISMPSFLKYSNGTFIVKSWDEMNPYGDNNGFLEGTYNDMLSNYGKNDAITGALNTWNKDALVGYITNEKNGITQYEFTLNGDKTYENTLLTGDNKDISKEFKITGSSGTITFKNIATSNGLTLGINGGTVNLTDGVSIGGDINFGDSSNVNLNVDAYYAGGVVSTVKNIIGNDKNSTISLTHVNITGDNNNGKIDLGAGNDTLTLKNVGVNSITGSGKNTIELNQGSMVDTIKLGEDSLAIVLDDNEFNNTITVNGGATVKTIDLTTSNNSEVTVNSGNVTDIKFGSGNDVLTYNGGNISSIDFGAGTNVLNVRADLNLKDLVITASDDGKVINTLNVGKTSSRSSETGDYLTLGGDFSIFKDINIEGATKLDSSLKLAQGTTINLGSNSLIAGINIENGVATTVLEGTELKAEANSELIIDTMKADSNTIISLDGIEGIDGVSKVDTNTIAHVISKNEDGTYKVEANKNLIDGEGNDLANGIISSDNGEGLFDGIADKEVQAQLLKDMTRDMMYNSPYAYSSIISRKTAEMVNNAVMDFNYQVNKNEWLAFGSILGSGKDMKDYYSGVSNVDQNIDSNIFGAYVQAEYGYTDNTALGFVVGANKSDSDIGKSSLDGKGVYLGGYVKHNYSENLQLIGGLAYQHSSYDSDRVAGNSSKTITYSEKYNDNTITGFVGGKYDYKLSETLMLQPNAKLNITHIMQDGVIESNKDASMKTDSKDFTNINTEVGVDLVKTITVENGNVKLKAGTSLTYLLDGADKENIGANLTNGQSSFNVVTPEQDKTNIKLKVGAQYEKTNGVIYNVEGSYITSSNENEWVVGAGIGYRF